MELKILILRPEQIESAAGFHTQGDFNNNNNNNYYYYYYYY